LHHRRGQTPYIGGRHHRHGLVERLEEAPHLAFAGRRDIPGGIFHEPGRSEKRDRNRQIAERVLHQAELGQQIGLRGLCADRRENHEPIRAGGQQRASEDFGEGAKLGKTRRRVEYRREQQKHRRGAAECFGRRRRVGKIDYRDFATALLPGGSLARAAHDSANLPPIGEQRASHDAADLSSDSRDDIHRSSPRCSKHRDAPTARQSYEGQETVRSGNCSRAPPSAAVVGA